MKTYEVIREEYVPCTGALTPSRREILELRLENPSLYGSAALTSQQDGSPVIEAVLEGGRKHRYIFCEL